MYSVLGTFGRDFKGQSWARQVARLKRPVLGTEKKSYVLGPGDFLARPSRPVLGTEKKSYVLGPGDFWARF